MALKLGLELMDPQLYVGKRQPQQHSFVQACNDPTRGIVHKPTGGLWTSTYLGEHGSGWVQWCLAEDFGCVDRWTSWLLYPRPEARVLTINTYTDLANAVERYPYDPYAALAVRGLHKVTLDFDAISQDYDAVHLTDNGQWATRLSHPLDLYGWDCESTCWLTWAFDRVESLGDITYSVILDEVATTP